MNLRIPKIIFLAIVLFLGCVNIFAEEVDSTSEEIAKIEKRGKEIADYERSAIRATDLLLASNPDKDKLGIYVAVNKNKVWTVFFGKIINNKFHFWYFYSCADGEFDKMRPGEELKDVPQDIFYFSQAVDLAMKAVQPEITFPRYNPSVFREEDGTITVYLLPGNQEADVILLGGDFKVSVSSDATQVLNKTKLHNSTLKIPLKLEGKQQPAGGFHTHILTDFPTETDVALVLLNPKLAPHYVTGQKWMSKIDNEGKITILGKTKEILKDTTPSK